MKKVIIINLLSFFLLNLLCLSSITTNATQDMTKNMYSLDESYFMLGSYIIDVANKTVSSQIYWEKDEMLPI